MALKLFLTFLLATSAIAQPATFVCEEIEWLEDSSVETTIEIVSCFQQTTTVRPSSKCKPTVFVQPFNLVVAPFTTPAIIMRESVVDVFSDA